MVKKRVSVDSDTKMPVEKRVIKRGQPEDGDYSPSVSDKEQRDIPNGKSKVNRELRSVRLDAARAKAANNNDEYHEVRSNRSGRRIVRPRQYNFGNQTDDDGDEDYVKKRTPARMNHNRVAKRGEVASVNNVSINSDRKKRLAAAAFREALNGTLPRRNLRRANERETSAEKNLNSIRRSTRQRKLKYENYSDSWIVGAQALIGYPMYDNSYSSKDRKMKGGVVYDDEEEEEEEEESPSVEDEEEEEEEESEENANEVNGATMDKTEEANNAENAVNGEEAPEEGGRVTRLRRACRDNQKQATGGNDAAFDDMYTRAKRPRTRGETNGTADSGKTRKGRKGKRGNGGTSSSEETNSEDRGYCLRKKRCQVDRLNVAGGPSRTIRRVLSPRRSRRSCSGSSASSSSDSGDQVEACQCKKSKKSIYNQLLPTTGSGVSKSGRLADVNPLSVDKKTRFSDVGGLEDHVRCLQEMVVFPMLYSEVFNKYQITVPKGVLFYGPPGTGKTLIARALSNECSSGARKVSFFMRKGADCMSKWVGESERQLRLLFEEAYQVRPSIIFFDEIDGLAPVRSSKQDQIHASIVSTLLALMDGLDDRGEVVVIGATNRIDAIDPALRRPGRFDRELLFPLPASRERLEILKIHTSKWECKPSDDELSKMADMCVGFCGSDLRALCAEAVITALGRRYPQIYKSSRKLQINPDCVKVEWSDFEEACKDMVPSSQRSAPAVARRLPIFLSPLFLRPLSELIAHLRVAFPSGFCKSSRGLQVVKSPRLLIIGQNKQTNLLSSALLFNMEQCPVHVLDLAALYCQSARLPEEACIQMFNEVRHTVPSIIYLPGVDTWWDTVSTTVQAVFLSMLNQLDPCLPILLLATAQNQLPSQLEHAFSVYRNEIYRVPSMTTDAEREAFFQPLILVRAVRPKPTPKSVVQEEELPFAPTPPPPKLSRKEISAIYRNEEDALRKFRGALRTVCARIIRQRAFDLFCKPVDVEQVPDYTSIIKKPMDIETIIEKINDHEYETVREFLADINLIVCNALEYNPNRTAEDKAIRNRACYLYDTAYALTREQINQKFEVLCAQIHDVRLQREKSPDRAYEPREYDWALTTQPRPSALLRESAAANNASDVGKNDAEVDAGQSDPAAKNNAKANNGENNGATTAANTGTQRKRKKLWSRGQIKKTANRTNVNNHDSSHSSSGNNSPKQEKSKTEPNSTKKVAQTSAAETPANNASSNSAQVSTSGKQSKAVKISPPIQHSTPVKRKKRSTQSEELALPSTSYASMNGVLHSDEEIVIDEEGTKDKENDAANTEKQNKKKGNEDLKLDDSFNVATIEAAIENDGEECNTVHVSRQALERILQEIVRVTQGVSSIELILDLYAQLRCVINRHLETNIRHGLPAELELEVKRFASQRDSLDIGHRRESCSSPASPELDVEVRCFANHKNSEVGQRRERCSSPSLTAASSKGFRNESPVGGSHSRNTRNNKPSSSFSNI